MILKKCNLSQRDLDEIRLGVIKLLFNDEFVLSSGEFVNHKDGTKTINIALKPKKIKVGSNEIGVDL